MTHLAVAFDNPIRSFRNDLFPAYKSDEGVPPELHAQFDPVEDAVRAMGVVVWSMREYEADDALATGARLYADAVDQVRIMTPGQGPRAVRARRARRAGRPPPAQGDGRGHVPDAARLRSRPASPTSWRWSATPPTASPACAASATRARRALIAAYEHIEAIPQHAFEWKVKPRGALQLAATLAEQREEALFYRKLATLIDTVPLAESLDDLRFRGVPRARFDDWCTRIGSDTLRTMPRRWADD